MDRITFSPLTEKTTVDVAIVGGGFCGLFCAFLLAKEGRRTAVFEKDGFFTRKTAPNILQYDAERSLSSLKNGFGYTAALNYYKLAYAALSEIKNVADEVGGEATVRDVFTYSEGDGADGEYRLRRCGGFEVEIIDGKSGIDLFSFPFGRGVYSPRGGLIVDREDLCEKLLCWLSVKGTELYENTRIDCVTQKSDGGFFLESKDGAAEARTVIDCRGENLLSCYPFLGRRETVFYLRTGPQKNFCGLYNRAFVRDMYAKPFYFLNDRSGRVAAVGGDLTSFGKLDGLLYPIFSERRFSELEKIISDSLCALDLSVLERGTFSYLRTKSVLPAAAADPLRRNYFYLTSGNKNTILSAWLSANCAVRKYLGRDTSEYSLLGI